MSNVQERKQINLIESEGCLDRCPEDLIHSAFLTAYMGAARRIELDPYCHLRRVRLPAAGVDADSHVAYSRFRELLSHSAAAAQLETFTPNVIAALRPFLLGVPTLLAIAQPTVSDALDVLCAHSSRLVGGVALEAQRRGADAALTVASAPCVALFCPERAPLALGVALRLVQSALGPDWRPRSVAFRRDPPADIRPYEQLFGAVSFAQPFDAMTIDTRDLVRSNPYVNPVLARLLAHHAEPMRPPVRVAFEDDVLAIIHELLPTGQCEMGRAAQQLGIDRRTIHRRLARKGVTFSDLVQTARENVLQRALDGEPRPVSTLATMAGFSSVSAFSRWFRQNFAVPPSAYRKAG